MFLIFSFRLHIQIFSCLSILFSCLLLFLFFKFYSVFFFFLLKVIIVLSDQCFHLFRLFTNSCPTLCNCQSCFLHLITLQYLLSLLKLYLSHKPCQFLYILNFKIYIIQIYKFGTTLELHNMTLHQINYF